MSNNTHIVTRVEFRWRHNEKEFAKLLSDSASKAGRCASDHARELMKDALTASEELQHHLFTLQKDIAQLHIQLQELSDIKEGLRTVHNNINSLRDELTSYVAKLLCDAGRMRLADAREWIDGLLKENEASMP